MQKNLRYRSSVINKKFNYLKNIDNFGVAYPLPFLHNIRHSIYEDPFDEFVFLNHTPLQFVQRKYLTFDRTGDFYDFDYELLDKKKIKYSDESDLDTFEYPFGYGLGKTAPKNIRKGISMKYDADFKNPVIKHNFSSSKNEVTTLEFYKDIKKPNIHKPFVIPKAVYETETGPSTISELESGFDVFNTELDRNLNLIPNSLLERKKVPALKYLRRRKAKFSDYFKKIERHVLRLKTSSWRRRLREYN